MNLDLGGGSRSKLKVALAEFGLECNLETELEKVDVGALRARGCDLAERGCFHEALVCFSAALQGYQSQSVGSPDYTAELHEMTAQVLMELGENFKAISHAEYSVAADSKWSCGWVTLARARREVGEVQLAIQAYGRALEVWSPTTDGVEEVQQELAELVRVAVQLGEAEQIERARLAVLDDPVEAEILTSKLHLQQRVAVGGTVDDNDNMAVVADSL